MADEIQTLRDETAFSVDASTGAPVATLGQIAAANDAMQRLAKDQGEATPHIEGLDAEPLDEAGYHDAVTSLKAAPEPLPSDEPNPSNSGDEDPASAPESASSGPTEA